jgi:hypothetical protein
MISGLRSSQNTAVIIKYWMPLVCAGGALGVFGREFPTLRFLPALPLLFIAFFQASLAVVELRGDVLRYRLLFKWREVPREDVVKATLIWAPFIGSIQLKKPISPWGRLYFVLDKNIEPNPFRGAEFPIVSCLNKNHTDTQTSSVPTNYDSFGLRLFTAAAIGILACLIILYLTPQDYLKTSHLGTSPSMPILLRVQFFLVEMFRSSPLQIAGLVFIMLLAAKRRNRTDSWLYGFLSGFALTAIIARFWM